MKEEQQEMLEELKKYNAEKERERKIRAQSELGCLAALATFGFMVVMIMIAASFSSDEDDCREYLRNSRI